jgi:dipeptidyl aminopeptidase/acylaminoacyl peptidase
MGIAAPSRYADFAPTQRFQPSIALSPDGSEVAYATNRDDAFNLWIQPAHGVGEPRQRTTFTDIAVRQMAWSPDGRSLAFAADRNGDDQFQIYLVSATDGDPVRLTTALDRQHDLAAAPFSPDGRYLAYGGNDRDIQVGDLIIHDLRTGERRRVESTIGIALIPQFWSPDGRWLLIAGLRSTTDIECLLLDLTDPNAKPYSVTPQQQGAGTLAHPGPWTADSRGFYLMTDASGDRVRLAYYRIDRGSSEICDALDWDVSDVVSAARMVVWEINDDGRSHLRACRDGQELPLPAIPPGVVTSMDLSENGTLALLIESATRPTDIAVVDLDSGDLTYLTDSRPAVLRTIDPVHQEHVTYQAYDERTIHGHLYRPHGAGPFPVVLSIHGGPEVQERPGYAYGGLYQLLLAAGIAVFAPNIRGSIGYGPEHTQLIYGDWGGGDLADLLAATDYLHTLDWIDPTRMAVFGRSYGGFAALTCLTQRPDLWAAGVSVYGPTDLIILAKDAPPTARDFINRMLGDLDDPDDVARLTQRSPITHAANITAPMLFTQGAHDSRVPKTGTDQIVASLREKNIPVTYLLYEDEGHGFTNRTNEIHAYGEIGDFLARHLGLAQVES